MKIKTNVMCGACISKVTPFLNEAVGEGNWNVDTTDPKKILSVNTESISEHELIDILEKAGYKGESL